MNKKLLDELKQLNPWLENHKAPILPKDHFIPRVQISEILDPEWDKVWTILVGPRRAGKTTLGKYLAGELLRQGRFEQLLYLNCDYLSIRKWLSSPLFITEAIEQLGLTKPILFIDEVQRIRDPGLLLKAIIDLGLPIKHIATGSSQLEIKSKVQEFLTGRQLSSTILPMSHQEWGLEKELEDVLVFGCYPQVLKSKKRELELQEIFRQYIQKDIVEILRVGHADVLQKLIGLLAHSSGQLFNLQQLSCDCRVSTSMIRNHLDILEQTFVIAKITPFVGNKRTELTQNPIYYFIDNGFRNIALRNTSPVSTRTDRGLLVESFVFQEIYKFKCQNYLLFDIHYWRTKSGAEVDFVLYKNCESFIPIEVKFQNMHRPTISRGFRSFIEAYQPKKALYITKDLSAKVKVGSCDVFFYPLSQISKAFAHIEMVLNR